MELEYRNITVRLNEKRILLDNVNGIVNPGEVVALMGASGSGKSTLLSVLAHRLDGSLTINEGPNTGVRYGGLKFSKSLKKLIAFVQQDDILLSNVTVFEHLLFNAQLRSPGGIKGKEKAVESMIELMRLQKCRDTVIGNLQEGGVSGGERKRVCIGAELLTNPAILLMDEPTSGLDSSTAHVLIEIVREIAKKHQIPVVCSIHQPATRTFILFDRVILLHGGKSYFDGSIPNLRCYLSKQGFVTPEEFSLSEYMLDLLVEQNATLIPQPYEFSTKGFTGAGAVTKFQGLFDDVLEESVKKRYYATWFEQFQLLLRRMNRPLYKSLLGIDTLMLNIALVIVGSLTFVRLGYDEANIFSRITCAFWLTATWAYIPLLSVIGAYHEDEDVLVKEVQDGAYRISAYYYAKAAAVVIPGLLWPIFYLICVLPITGLPTSVAGGFLLFFYYLLNVLVFQSVGLFLSAALPSHILVTVAVIELTINFAFAGLFVLPSQLAVWLQWIPYVNWLYYGFQLAGQLAVDANFACTSSNSGYAVCDTGSVITAQDVYDKFDLTIPKYVSALALIAVAILFRIAGLPFFKKRVKKSSWKFCWGKSKRSTDVEDFNQPHE